MDLADELNEHLRHAIAEDPLHAVAEVARFKAALAGLEREAVFAALAEHSWRSIGQALGVSRRPFSGSAGSGSTARRRS